MLLYISLLLLLLCVIFVGVQLQGALNSYNYKAYNIV